MRHNTVLAKTKLNAPGGNSEHLTDYHLTNVLSYVGIKPSVTWFRQFNLGHSNVNLVVTAKLTDG